MIPIRLSITIKGLDAALDRIHAIMAELSAKYHDHEADVLAELALRWGAV